MIHNLFNPNINTKHIKREFYQLSTDSEITAIILTININYYNVLRSKHVTTRQKETNKQYDINVIKYLNLT